MTAVIIYSSFIWQMRRISPSARKGSSLFLPAITSIPGRPGRTWLPVWPATAANARRCTGTSTTCARKPTSSPPCPSGRRMTWSTTWPGRRCRGRLAYRGLWLYRLRLPVPSLRFCRKSHPLPAFHPGRRRLPHEPPGLVDDRYRRFREKRLVRPFFYAIMG